MPASAQLGRRVYSRSQMKSVRQQRSDAYKVFLTQRGSCEASVDYLVPSIRARDLLCRIAIRDAVRRPSPFQGWATVTADVAQENGRRVQRTPICRNPFHADLVFPKTVSYADEERKRHAYELVVAAHFVEPPVGQAAASTPRIDTPPPSC